jgi:eukaryotic-like serine/threonine-protein kinase
MTDRVGQHLGNYHLLRLLGHGGFADVYLGEHLYLQSLAALKLLHSQLSEEETARFLTEARTLARLSHPHIVRVLDFALHEGFPFLVMEYAPGGSLRQRHPAGSRLPLATIVSYLTRSPPPCNTPTISTSSTAMSSLKTCCLMHETRSC